MTTHLALDAEHGTYCPPTRGMERIASLDQIISEELARRCGLRSWREAHPEEVRAFCPCGCGVRIPAGQRYASGYCEHRMALRASATEKRCECGSPGPLGYTGRCPKCTKAHAIAIRYKALGIEPIKPGRRWGKRTVIRESPVRTGDGKVQYQVRCDCGRNDLVSGTDIRRGRNPRCARCAASEREQSRRAG